MSIVNFYRELFKDISLKATTEGYINLELDKEAEKEEPWFVDGKRAVIPTETQLSERGLAEKFLFNPLHEDVLSRESETISRLRNLINIRLNQSTAVLLSALIGLAESKQDHKKIQIKNSEFLSILKDVDSQSVVDFQRLLGGAIAQNKFTKSIWSVYLKHGGTIDDKKYARVATFTNVLYDEIKEKKDKYFGVSGIRVRDIVMFRSLLEYIFSDLKTKGAYVFGSNDDTAPYLHVLLSGFKDVAGEINYMEKIASAVLPDEEGVRFELDWVSDLKDFDKFRKELRSIPTQDSAAPRKVADKLTDGHNMAGKFTQSAAQAQKEYDEKHKQVETTPPWEENKPAGLPAPVSNANAAFAPPPPAPVHQSTVTISAAKFFGVPEGQQLPTNQGFQAPYQRATLDNRNNSFFGTSGGGMQQPAQSGWSNNRGGFGQSGFF